MGTFSTTASNEYGKAKRGVRRVAILGAALGLTVAIATGSLLYQQHNKTLEDAKRELLNVAIILGEQIDRSFQSVDLVQSSLLERIQNLRVGSREECEHFLSSREIHDLLKEKISGLPQIDAVTLICCDTAIMLDRIEESLDEIPRNVEVAAE